MNFTKLEQTVIIELEKRAGDVLYFEDIAPYFISKSLLEISTYTQTAYVRLGDSMQSALSEYFQVVVFLKKIEKNGVCFSIPYTPLVDNATEIGNNDYEDYQQHTIADGDLLIQLFHYAAKKYVIAPRVSADFQERPQQSKLSLLIPSLILVVLFIFIGIIGYRAYLDNNILKLQQTELERGLKKQSFAIELLSEGLKENQKRQEEIRKQVLDDIIVIKSDLKSQNRSLRNINYWNRKQSLQIENLIKIASSDSVK